MPDLESITNFLKGIVGKTPSYSTDPPKYFPSSQNEPYPTTNDVIGARGNDYSYGQPWAPEFQGLGGRFLTQKLSSTEGNVLDKSRPFYGTKFRQVTDDYPDIGELYGKAGLASQRSGLAALGFDPNRTALDTFHDPHRVNKTGEYDADNDSIYANAREPSVVLHESIHRGIDKLNKTPFWKKEFDPFMQDPLNESTVRWLMMNKMGNPEGKDADADIEKKQMEKANSLFRGDYSINQRRRELLDQLEGAAAQAYAAKRPGGPR